MNVFDGPLDLLLHLISKNKVNIYDIPITEILEQYNASLHEMEERDLNITCDFVAMSAQLLYIKSKMLLPIHEEADEEDPRSQLVEMLLEYQKIKEVSGVLHSRSEIGGKLFVKPQEIIELDKKYKYVHNKIDLKNAVFRILERVENKLPPPISSFDGIVGREVCSVASKTAAILKKLLKTGITTFKSLFKSVGTRSEVVATFLAVLELCKSNRILISEDERDGISIGLNLDT